MTPPRSRISSGSGVRRATGSTSASGPHARLQADLAQHLRRKYNGKAMVFTEVALSGTWSSHGRLDVVAIWTYRGYSQQRTHGYEVKASRSDLLGDLRAGKWRRYLHDVDHMYFAMPDGLAKLDEIPKECGVIIQLAEGQWRIIRRAPRVERQQDLTTPWRLLRRAYGQGS